MTEEELQQDRQNAQHQIMLLKAENYDQSKRYAELYQQATLFAKSIATELGINPSESGVLTTDAVLNAIRNIKGASNS